MAWSGLIRVWDPKREEYRKLVVRIEETQGPGWLARLYDGETAIGEHLADDPKAAIDGALEIAQSYLHVASITEESLDWVQL